MELEPMSESNSIVVRKPNKFAQILMSWYDPIPMEKPDIGEIDKGIRGVVEALRFSLSDMMYKLSPKGTIQAWWKLLIRVVFVIVPFLAVTSLILMGVASVFTQIEIITNLIKYITENVMWSCIYFIAICLLVSLFLRIIIPLLQKSFSKVI